MDWHECSPHGSSPRMRGKPSCLQCRAGPSRIIPAHAGQTALLNSSAVISPDHPRACGANLGMLSFLLAARGSSPRMRGKRVLGRDQVTAFRIIPAHAGQTRLFDGVPTSVPDHPRACGANGWIAFDIARIRGSSPRMRGKRHRRATRPRATRIIPAHAGQT